MSETTQAKRRGGIRLFVRQVVAELRKVVRPTRNELVTYTSVVLVFVLAVMTYVSLLDFGFGRLVLWVCAMVLVLVALVSPLDAISEQLASAHMVQHLILADLVPIAMILALSKLILRPLTRSIHDLERRAVQLRDAVRRADREQARTLAAIERIVDRVWDDPTLAIDWRLAPGARPLPVAAVMP